MKSSLVKLSTLVCMLGIWATASADFREVFTCTIKEGKTMDIDPFTGSDDQADEPSL